MTSTSKPTLPAAGATVTIRRSARSDATLRGTVAKVVDTARGPWVWVDIGKGVIAKVRPALIIR